MKKLMEHKGKLFWSSLLVLLPVPVVWALQGKVLLAPFFFLALHWVALLITFHNNKEKNQGKKAIGMVFFLVPMLSLLTAVAFCLSRSGRSQWIPTIMSLGFGVLFVVVGNNLPKVRKNETLGIRVPWAMWDEENWNATHRFGGRVWVIGGFLCLVCGLMPGGEIPMLIFIGVILTVAVAPCLYSYLYYKKQLREGKTAKLRTSPLSALILLAVLALVIWGLFAGSMEVVFGEASFTVETGNWSDLTVHYADIESVTYEEEDPSQDISGSRTYGFGNFRLSMGSFENEIYGDYTRYTYASCHACVVLRVKGETVVLNGPDEARTREIYETLLQKTGLPAAA